jgi:hypothetical protein
VLACAVLGLSVLTAALVSSARAHTDGFTGGITIDRTLCWDGCRLVSDNLHSWSFVSANDVDAHENAYVCPGIIGWTEDKECGYDFERYCWFEYTHSSNDLDCHDRDGNAWRWLVENNGFWHGSFNNQDVIRGHATY